MIAWVSTVAKKLSKSGLARFRAKAWPACVLREDCRRDG